MGRGARVADASQIRIEVDDRLARTTFKGIYHELGLGRSFETCYTTLHASSKSSREFADKRGGVAVTEIEQKIGLKAAFREKFGVDLGIVKSGHRATIRPKAGCRHDHVGTLKRSIS